ncbi:umecyanin-like [Silene latifolia]|uniref:umecyanin-like n=1 Tax=Silene latifolia TaxID=37657 RepID=UPI003D77FABA
MAKTSMVVMIVAMMMLISGIAAKNLTVGDEMGWKVPSSDDFYTTWAANQTFVVGDILVFNFDTGAHTVAITSRDAYDDCDKDIDADAIEVEEGPYERTLDSAGQFYFFCTIGFHCANGLKFSANVTGTPAPAP